MLNACACERVVRVVGGVACRFFWVGVAVMVVLVLVACACDGRVLVLSECLNECSSLYVVCVLCVYC